MSYLVLQESLLHRGRNTVNELTVLNWDVP